MIGQLKKKRKKQSIGWVCEQIQLAESIFYKNVPAKEGLAYDKVNAQSQSYDRHYEQKVRRKELNLLHILDEMPLPHASETYDAMYLLDELENFISSPQFYRQLIFQGISAVPEKLKDISLLLKEYAGCTISNDFSDKDYLIAVKELQFMSPPKTRSEFYKNLVALIEDLELISKKIKIFSH